MADGKLVPDLDRMEETILHMPAFQIDAVKTHGWWKVRIRVEPDGQLYSGTKDRSYFSALAKALDVTLKATH